MSYKRLQTFLSAQKRIFFAPCHTWRKKSFFLWWLSLNDLLALVVATLMVTSQNSRHWQHSHNSQFLISLLLPLLSRICARMYLSTCWLRSGNISNMPSDIQVTATLSTCTPPIPTFQARCPYLYAVHFV